MVVPNSPGLVIVEVDIPFSVGLRKEGVGQDAPRSIKWQVVPMPVPAGGRGQSQWLLTAGACSQKGPRLLVHLVKSIVMSAWPSCTSVKVSGVTSLHTCRASATVCRTCSRTSCHGNRRILRGGGRAWTSLRAGSAPDGCWARGCPWMLGRGICTWGPGQVNLRCRALVLLPHGHNFVWDGVLRYT